MRSLALLHPAVKETALWKPRHVYAYQPGLLVVCSLDTGIISPRGATNAREAGIPSVVLVLCRFNLLKQLDGVGFG